MQPKRAVLKTDRQGHLESVPALPPDSTIEATFVVLASGANGASRKAPADLAGLKIVGDIVSPAIDEDDWNLMK